MTHDFETVVRKHRRTWMRGAGMMTHNSPIEAEDLFQQTMLVAWINWPKICDHPNIIGVIGQLLYWTRSEMQKKATNPKRNDGVLPVSIDMLAMETAYEPSVPASQAIVLDMIDMERILASVKPKLRDTVLRHGNGDTMTEIAADHGVTVQAVQQRISRFRSETLSTYA